MLLELPLSERRARLEAIGGLTLTDLVHTPQEAERWLQTAEGVIAKRTDAPYMPGERVGIVGGAVAGAVTLLVVLRGVVRRRRG